MRPLLLLLAVALLAGAEVDDLWFLDEARGRNLGAKVYHPDAGDGPWPVVLVSHALGGSQWGYVYLGRHLAAHGIVSIHCTHPGSDWLLWDGKGMGTALGNLRRAAADPAVWRERPRDLGFLLDRLDEFERRVPALAGRLARDRVAAIGHSLGAYTVLALAGLRPTLPEGELRLDDPRFRAVVAMSPQGTGDFLPVGSWSGIVRPVLLISGTRDDEPMAGRGHGLPWRMQAWEGIPEGAKHLFVIDGATHMTFAAGGLGEKAVPAHLDLICTATSAFLAAALADPAREFSPPTLAGATWDQPLRAR